MFYWALFPEDATGIVPIRDMSAADILGEPSSGGFASSRVLPPWSGSVGEVLTDSSELCVPAHASDAVPLSQEAQDETGAHRGCVIPAAVLCSGAAPLRSGDLAIVADREHLKEPAIEEAWRPATLKQAEGADRAWIDSYRFWPDTRSLVCFSSSARRSANGSLSACDAG